MRVVILTSSSTGTASLCLPYLVNAGITVDRIVYAQGGVPNRLRHLKRKARKVLKIGPLGALNGIRMRKWYDDETLDVRMLARMYEVPLDITPSVNSDETKAAFRDANADLGLSLGNPYISESVFSIPRYGMLNIHGEVLPEFKGAQPVIWSIHEGLRATGFTIHQISNEIDGGTILLRKVLPIEFQDTLEATARHNARLVGRAAAEALPKVIEQYHALVAAAIWTTNAVGRTYTTPTIWQYLHMRRQHDRLRAEV